MITKFPIWLTEKMYFMRVGWTFQTWDLFYVLFCNKIGIICSLDVYLNWRIFSRILWRLRSAVDCIIYIVQNKWKIRLQLTKPVTWPPLVWGVVCGAAASGTVLLYIVELILYVVKHFILDISAHTWFFKSFCMFLD